MKIQTNAKSVHFNERYQGAYYDVTFELNELFSKQLLKDCWSYHIQQGKQVVDQMALERVIDLIDLDDKEVIKILKERLK